jgi:hypothetical protein
MTAAISFYKVIDALDLLGHLPAQVDGRQNGRRRLMVRCPAHDDRSPSLSIEHKHDRTLIHCFAGCEAERVVEAIGLTLTDLYDDRVPDVVPLRGRGSAAPRHRALESGFDARKFKVLDVAMLVAEEPPEVPWQIDGLAVRGDVTVMTGDPGAGKSLLALVLGAAVARGESIAGPDFAGLDGLVSHFEPCLLVLDSLTALWPGANERKTEDVAPTLYRLKHLAERHGVAIVVLHHRPKDGGEYRGTTAIAAAAQLGFTLSKVKDDPERTRRRLHCWKCRPAPEPGDRWLHLDAERGMVLVAVAEPYVSSEEPERSPAPRRDGYVPGILDALDAAGSGSRRSPGRSGPTRRTGRCAVPSTTWCRPTRSSARRQEVRAGPGAGCRRR